MMKNKLFFMVILVIAVAEWFVLGKNINPKLKEMKIGEVKIKYELAQTPKEVELGLSYRKEIPDGQGMLFVFSKPGLRTFWMHEMLVPLDIIWIADNKIVEIDENVPIKTNGAWTIVTPNYPADKVLELNGGEAFRLGIKNGAEIKL